MAKKYEMSFELNGDIDPRLSRTFDTLSKDVTDLGKDLNTLGRSKGFSNITRDAEEATGAFHELRENAKEFGEIFSRVGQYTGAYAIIEQITGSLGEMINTIGELDAQSGQLAAASGATAGELAGLQDISESLYLDGLGEGVNDLTDALIIARNVTKQQGDELEKTTRNAIVLQDVFRFDIPESVKASDTMMRQFGITTEESMNLLAQGAQKGLDKSGELLDSANEYAPQFAAMGYSANEMFDIFAQGLEAGAWNLDKVGDLIKEFNIRIKDGSDKTSDALSELFAPYNIVEFVDALTKNGKKSQEYIQLLGHVSKETADQMVANLKKGGKKASDTYDTISMIMGKGQKILDGLTNGSLTGKQVMESVISELSRIEDPITKARLGVELFGTQWEDLEVDVVKSMSTVNSQFDMTKSTMEDMAAVKYDNITQELKVLGRELMDELIIPIGEDLMPALKDVTAWASDNKDLIKTLALAVPAAMLTKNAVGMAKDFGKVGKAVFDTTDGVSKFSRVIGFMTNPIGLAVGAVGALTLGVISYKKHQEQARQELINMSEELKEASNQYDEAAEKAKQTNDLVWTYNNLSDAIAESSGNSQELAAQKEKLAAVTERLQELYPDTITQYDIENDKVREKVGLLKQESDAELELARLRLEKEAAEGQRKLPALEDEIQSLEKQTAELQEQKQALDNAIPKFKEYQAEFQKIMQEDFSDERTAKLEGLRQKLNEAGESVGYFFSNNAQMGNLDQVIGDLSDEKIGKLDSYIAKLDELSKAQNSYEKLYQTQVNLIELDYGADLEGQAGKYSKLSQEEQQRFMRAMDDVANLQKEMDLLPTEKQINVDVLYRQIFNPIDLFQPPKKGEGFNGYANGGRVTQPELAWIGEGGDDEFVIPVNNSKRSRGLYAAAGEALGVSPTSNFAPVYSPQIVIKGNADEQMVCTVINDSQRNWEAHLSAYERNRQRVSLSR